MIASTRARPHLKAAPDEALSPTAGRSHTYSRTSPMPDIVKDTRYLRTKEAAHYVGLSARTLEKHRTYGTGPAYRKVGGRVLRSEEHTSELQSLMRISYAVFCLQKK